MMWLSLWTQLYLNLVLDFLFACVNNFLFFLNLIWIELLATDDREIFNRYSVSCFKGWEVRENSLKNKFPLVELKQSFCNVYRENLLQKENYYKWICKIYAYTSFYL